MLLALRLVTAEAQLGAKKEEAPANVRLPGEHAGGKAPPLCGE
jgi:hypothetical protein